MTVTQSYGPPRSKSTFVVALVAAALIVIMLLGQLFSYEDFGVTLAAVMPFNDLPLVVVLAAGIVLVELLALPYLLGMYISSLMRCVSAVAAATVGMFWLIIGLTNAHALNIGFMSSTVTIHGGILAALLGATLFGLIVKVIAADSKFRHESPTY